MKTDKEWLECEAPGDLIRASMNRSSNLWWNGISREPSDRKLTLISCGIASITYYKEPSFQEFISSWYNDIESEQWERLNDPKYSAFDWTENWKGKEAIAVSNLVRDVLGNPFRATWRDWKNLGEGEWMGMKANISVRAAPAWLNPKVKALAQLIYDEADFASLPILADMLEDEGCNCEETLKHLRPPCTKCGGDGKQWLTANVWTKEPLPCGHCDGSGLEPAQHFRGCWALDLLLGKG